MRPHGGCGRLGLVDGLVCAWVSRQPPGAESRIQTPLWPLDLLVPCVYLARFLDGVCTYHNKSKPQSATAPVDLENTKAIWSKMHLSVPSTLRASNCPQSWPPRSCSAPGDLSWARCGAWAELSGAYDVAVPKRVESGGETAKDLHAAKNFWMGVNPVSSLWGKNHSCSKNMVNSLLWFIGIITHGFSLRAFSHEFLIASFSASLKSCGLRNRSETMATSDPSQFLIKNTGRHTSQLPITILFIWFEKLQHVKYFWGASVIGYKEQEYRNYFRQIYFVHIRGSVRKLRTHRSRYFVLFIVNL